MANRRKNGCSVGYVKLFLAGALCGLLLATLWMRLSRPPLQRYLCELEAIFPTNLIKMEESADDIASDIYYDKKMSSIFPLTAAASDIDLTRQKLYYQNQKERVDKLTNADLFWVQWVYIPQVNCPNKIRVGSIGEPGYVMCNPWLLSEFQDPCIVYSLGTQGMVEFEEKLYEISGGRCEIIAIDEHEEADLAIFEKFKGKFFRAFLSTRSEPAKGIYTLMDITQRNGHNRKIDVLKVDVEGAEFRILPPFLRQFNGTICHLLLEVHANGNYDGNVWVQFFRMLERRGFRLFEKEHYPLGGRWVQYSFLHLNCFESYKIKPEAVVLRYFA